MPCADFLTNVEVRAPAAACCDGLRSIVSGAPICLCHVANGDIGELLLPAPVNMSRTIDVVSECGIGFKADDIYDICITNHGKCLISMSSHGYIS